MELKEYTSTLCMDNLLWSYIKAIPAAKETTKSTAPKTTPIRGNVRICRRILNEQPSLLALPCDDAFSGNAETFIFYEKTMAKPALDRVLKNLCLTESWRPSGHELDEGVPFNLFQEATKFAILHYLSQRGWIRIGQYLVQTEAGSLGSSTPLLAVKMFSWINSIQSKVSFAVEGVVCKVIPLNWETVNNHHFMVEGRVAIGEGTASESMDSEDLATLKCRCLPSLKPTVVVSVSKKPPSRPGLATEKDFRDYWQEVHGYTLPTTIKGYITVTFGLWQRTYPTCCLCSQDVTILASQTKQKQQEIVNTFLKTLNEITIGGKQLTLTDPIPKTVDIAWQTIPEIGISVPKPQTSKKLIVPKFPKRKPTIISTPAPAPLNDASPSVRTTETVVPSSPPKATKLAVPQFAKPKPSQQSRRPSPLPPKVPEPQKPKTPTKPKDPPKAKEVPPIPKESPPKESEPQVTSKRKRAETPKKTKTANPPPKEQATATPKEKRPKKQAKTVDLNTIDFKELMKTNKLATLSVPVLQTYCRQNNVGRIPRKKDELLRLVTAHISK